MSGNFSFENNEAFFLLILLPLLIFWYYWRERKGLKASLKYSNVGFLKGLNSGILIHLRHLPFLLRLAGLALLIVALARPRYENQKQRVFSEGIDIVLCIDLSASMLAEDFKPNRIEAAKSVAKEFIDNRKTDRLGLIIFSAKAFTQCPLTLDYGLLKSLISKLEAGKIDESGTAIGTAIATATNRLRDSKSKSRIIILLTDGQNNAGEVDPITAAQLANALGIKIYTVGAGTRGYANYPYDDPIFGRRYMKVPVDVDDEGLTKIASITGGRYFRATDFNNLKRTYEEINKLEKTKVEIETYSEYKEEFLKYLLAGISCILLEFLLINTRFRKFP